MKRRISTFATIVLALAMTIPTVSHASPSPGAGVAAFQCQLVIGFPNVIPKSPAKTNCDGAAWGAGVGVGKDGSAWTSGVEPTKGLIALGPLLNPKKNTNGCTKPIDPILNPTGGCEGKFENFEAYNIKYSEICAAGEAFPGVGFANGYAFINGNDPLKGGRSIVAHFSYIRVGIVFVATLDSVNAYNFKQTKPGGPKPTIGGAGAAAGFFLVKLPLGGCTTGTSNPQQHIIITGVVAAQF